MNGVTLREDILTKLGEIGEADILVGIPSYNNANTIGHVVKAVQTGFAKYFPDRKCILVNSDGGSKDRTMDVVQETGIADLQSILLHHRTGPVFKIATPYHGIPGKGSAFRTIFEIASALNVKACAVVDSDLRSITPEWIELLVKPVIEQGFDYVAPLYHRHKYDGTITNSIVYPVTRALYGTRVRQPIGGDFGFSGAMAKHYLTKDVWETDVARYGIDIWMTTTAIADGFKVCQSFLGAKIHDAKDPGADLSAMLHQVVGATIDLMETYPAIWNKTEGSVATPVFGFTFAVGLEPVTVNIDRMLERFRLGVKELNDVWELFLPKEITAILQSAAAAQKDQFHIPDEVWAEIVYRFAIAAHHKVLNREHLLKSLTPLYIGRTASFVMDTRDSNSDEVEAKIEELCRQYEIKKTILKDNWNTKGGAA